MSPAKKAPKSGAGKVGKTARRINKSCGGKKKLGKKTGMK